MKKSRVFLSIILFAIVISIVVFKLISRVKILEAKSDISECVESTEDSEPTFNLVEPKETPAKARNLNELKFTYSQEAKYVYEDATELSYVETEPNYYELTYDEIDMLARLVYLEAGGESYECMKGVTSAILNRMTSTGMSLHDVIYEPGQFSPACYIESTCYTDTVYSAVIDVVENGPSLPEYVTFFRANHYHDFGNNIVVPYTFINNTYFSADIRLMEG